MTALVFCFWLCHEPLYIGRAEVCYALKVKMAVEGLECRRVEP
jgi:hypothetical protein